MVRDMRRNIYLMILIIGFLMGLGCGMLQLRAETTVEETQPSTSAPSQYNTSALEGWCGNDDTEIKMISATVYMQADDLTILEDEEGNLWKVSHMNIDENDFIMLWISTEHTTDVKDDIVLKVWAECH